MTTLEFTGLDGKAHEATMVAEAPCSRTWAQLDTGDIVLVNPKTGKQEEADFQRDLRLAKALAERGSVHLVVNTKIHLAECKHAFGHPGGWAAQYVAHLLVTRGRVFLKRRDIEFCECCNV